MKMRLSTKYIIVGCALIAVLVSIGVFIFLNLGNNRDALAATSKPLIVSRASGDWASTSSWLRNNLPSVPQDGDSIVIRSGHTITMQSSETINNIRLQVYGNLWIENGKKLWVNRASFIEVMLSNGKIDGVNSGTKIVIDNKDVWNAGMGAINPYSTIGYNEGVQNNVTLPVELIYFRSKLKDKQVLLEWSTLKEINNEYFTVERSTDGKNYQMAVKVAGAGTTKETSWYSYIDQAPLPRLSYYRLKQTDYDGTSKYSKMTAVSNDAQNVKGASGSYSRNAENAAGIQVVAMGPNPFEKSFFADFDLTNEGQVMIQLTDAQGKVYESKTMDGVVGSNHYEFNDEQNLQPGIYLFSLKQQIGSAKVMRLVKK
jgi:hypothetical protein